MIRVSNYIQRFELNIRYKFEKQHIIFDVFFKLVNDNINVLNHDEKKLDVFFIVSLMKMKSKFKQRILNDYFVDFKWKQIAKQLINDVNNEIVTKLFFCKKKKTISFFVLMISSSMFTRTSHVVYVYFTSSCRIFFNCRMTKENISIMLNVMNVSFRHDTFAIYHVIYEIIWNIVFNVKFIKRNVIRRTNFYNQYWRRQFFFTLLL